MKNHRAWNYDLSRKINSAGWGIFLIFTGLIWLLTDFINRIEYYLIGVGIIMVSVRVYKQFKNIRASETPLVIGLILIIYGLTGLFGSNPSLLGAVILVIGLFILINSLRKREKDKNAQE